MLLVLAGLEMLLIPLTGVLARGQIKLVIYVGVGGIFGILIGALLIASGLALWFNDAHKTFYSIAGVLLAILSFIGTNLGGFFIGMLLGIVGGSLAFAWAPATEAGTDDFRPPPPPEPRSEGVGLILGEQPDDDTLPNRASGNDAPADRSSGVRDAERPGGPADGMASGQGYLGAPTGPRHRGRGGSRAIAVAALAALAAGTMLTTGRASAAETAPTQPEASQGCILFVICTPSPSPSAPAPAPSSPGGGSGGSGTSPSTGGIVPSGSASPGATSSAGSGSKTKKAASKKASATAGLVVSSTTSVLNASSATLDGLAYQGVVNMPVTGGGTVQMMKFTMKSQALTTATQTVTESGRTLKTDLASATFSGSVVLYATKLSGTLLGVPITLSPGNVVSTLLQLLNTLTPSIPVTMKGVTADQPVLLANVAVISGLGVSAS
jgi:hypothetical protein